MLHVLTLPFVALHLATFNPAPALTVSVYAAQGSGPLTVRTLEPTARPLQVVPTYNTQSFIAPTYQPAIGVNIDRLSLQ